MIVIIPIVLIFSIFEINKKNMALFLEDNKLNLLQSNNVSKAKILINKVGNKKTYTIFKNLDLNNLENTEYRSYNIDNREIINLSKSSLLREKIKEIEISKYNNVNVDQKYLESIVK